MIGQHDTRNSKLFYAVRGFTVFLWFFIIYKLTSLIIKLQTLSTSSRDVSILSGFPDYAVYITISVGAIFIFNSVSLVFDTFDKDEIKNYLESEKDGISLFGEARDILKTPHLVIQIISTLLFVAICALLGGFSEIGSIFFESSHRGGWFPTVILLPICFILSVLSKYEARRYWHYLNRINELERINKPSSFYKRFSLIFFLYPLVFPYAPLLAFIVYSFVSVLISLFGALTVAGLIATAVIVPMFIFVFPIFKRKSRKKHFIKDLKLIAEREGYEIRFSESNGEALAESSKILKFDLVYKNQIYNCLVIGTSRRGIPLVFTSPTSAYFEHRLGTREHHISINKNIDFFLHGEGIKIIIVNPSPKHVFVTDGIKMKRLSSADKIWNYTVHDNISFLGSMDRKCLDRSNTDYN